MGAINSFNQLFLLDWLQLQQLGLSSCPQHGLDFLVVGQGESSLSILQDTINTYHSSRQ